MTPQKEMVKDTAQKTAHWLDRYATGYHAWTSTTTNDQTTFTRPLGLVETSFDTDGVYYGGRADMTATLTVAIAHTLSIEQFRHRIALAWTALRLRHVLLMSRRVEDDAGLPWFAIDIPLNLDRAVEAVKKSIIWVEDSYPSIDATDFHNHALNASRVIHPHDCLSKLHVLPLRTSPDGTLELPLLIVMAHQISDGLAAYGWFKDFLHLLNLPRHTLEAEISSALAPAAVKQKLPPAQEDLYPSIQGSKARQRWIWAILRVLRHVKRDPPRTIPNPLRRESRVSRLALPHRYERIFTYEGPNMPVLSTAHLSASLSAAASERLTRLCRAAGVSIGAGCFALAGLAMMKVHSRRFPRSQIDEDTASALPLLSASFPLNPRAFFESAPPAESCMLTFSSGIVMPFPPRSLSVETQFILTARTANRGLRVYQKRGRVSRGSVSTTAPVPTPPTPPVPGQARSKHTLDTTALLATSYLTQLDRVLAFLPAPRTLGFPSPQGTLPAPPFVPATCGVSSVGSLAAYLRPGTYSLELSSTSNAQEKGRDFAADYRGLRMGVRAREGEFLVGSWTDGEGRVGVGVSFDECGVFGARAEEWAGEVRGLLEGRARL